MSESDLSDAPSERVPPDSKLERALENQVKAALKDGGQDSVTIQSVRKAAELELGLPAGFYKTSEGWKERSRRIVHEAFV